MKASMMKLVQPYIFSARLEPRLAPVVRHDRGPDRAGVDLEAGERRAHRRRECCFGSHVRDQDAAALVDDRGERVRQDDARVLEHAAPVAGMAAALAQVDREIEGEPAARCRA